MFKVCPALDTVFVLAVAHFLRMPNKTVAGSTTRASTDDICSVISKISDLRLLQSLFHLFRTIRPPPPHPPIAPFYLCGHLLTKQDQIKAYLKKEVWSWVTISITSKA